MKLCGQNVTRNETVIRNVHTDRTQAETNLEKMSLAHEEEVFQGLQPLQQRALVNLTRSTHLNLRTGGAVNRTHHHAPQMLGHNPSDLLNGLAQHVGIESGSLLQRGKNLPEQQQMLIECASRVSRSFCIRVLKGCGFAVATTQDLQSFPDEKNFGSCFRGKIRLGQHRHVHHVTVGTSNDKQALTTTRSIQVKQYT